MYRVVVVAGGDLHPAELDRIDPARDHVIAADGGAKALLERGVKPHLAVGDFDTAGDDFIGRLETLGVAVERLPAAKAVTDLHYALMKACELRPATVRVFGALGGKRFDHMLANVSLLEWLHEQGTKGILEHVGNRIRLLVGPGMAELPREGFRYVSLIPVSHTVAEVRTEGLLYPLNREPLYRHMSRGISNEWAADMALVSIGEGKLLIVESREEGEE